MLGFTDRQCRLCFGLSLWNTKDPILKERLFGLINSEGITLFIYNFDFVIKPSNIILAILHMHNDKTRNNTFLIFLITKLLIKFDQLRDSFL